MGVFLKDLGRGRCLDPLFGYVAKEPNRWFPKWMFDPGRVHQYRGVYDQHHTPEKRSDR